MLTRRNLLLSSVAMVLFPVPKPLSNLEVMRFQGKLLLNSIYGKLAQDK
jgi:hypothetical protein